MTVGRRSGKGDSVIVGYVEDGDTPVVLAMNGWDEGHPAPANPQASCGKAKKNAS